MAEYLETRFSYLILKIVSNHSLGLLKNSTFGYPLKTLGLESIFKNDYNTLIDLTLKLGEPPRCL